MGIVFPLLAVLLISCASFLSAEQKQPVDDTPNGSDTVSSTSTSSPSATETEPAADQPDGNKADDTPTPALSQASDSIAGIQPQLEPVMGEIIFALDITKDYEPVDPNIIFTHGITEVHAIFEYSQMLPEYTWERVWYLNDKEVGRIAETWTGPESGTFDYSVDNSGRPLPAGDWILELYAEDKLLALGVFIIEESDETQTGGSSGPYLLAYTKCDGDHHNIYVADTNGNNEQLIVTRGAGPSWTPGGGAIFFFGEVGVDRQAREGIEYVFDGISDGLVAVNTAPIPTGINQLNLFQYVEWKQGTARWANVSPDGSMVAFDARPGGDYRIYFLGTDANQQFRYEIIGEQADWSPDSQKIVYRSGRNGQTGLWISNRDDSGHIRITDNGSDSFPAWSPNGQTIAFSRDNGGNVDIFAVNVDGSNLRQLTTTPGHDTLPVYTPNGDIIFRSARSGKWEILKMKGDGSNQKTIIPNTCVGNDWAFSKMDVLR